MNVSIAREPHLEHTPHCWVLTASSINIMDFSLMGLIFDQSANTEFSDQVPPRFDGHGNYVTCRENVRLRINPTSLPASKHRLAIVGHLHEEAKIPKRPLQPKVRMEGSLGVIPERLDKAYAVGRTNQLDAVLADFLDYIWREELRAGHFISGFRIRDEIITSRILDENLKGNFLLCQADLHYHEIHVVIGTASGSYDVTQISATLRNIYSNTAPTSSSHCDCPGDDQSRGTNDKSGH